MKIFSPRLAFAFTACAASLGTLAFSHSAFAQGYSTDFNYPTFTSGETVSDQNGWVTNDEYTGASLTTMGVTTFIGQSDEVNTASPYTTGTSDYAASIGGFLNANGGAVPGRQAVTLTHPVTLTGPTATFGTDYVVTTPGTVHTAHDQFGFVLQNAAATANLVTISFSATTAQPNTLDNITITSNGTVTNINPSSFALNSRYRLSMSINLVASTFTVSLQPESASGTLSGTASTLLATGSYTGTIANAGATWTLNSAANTPATATGANPNGGPDTNTTAFTGGGDNALIFDNFSLVPEPSTYALLALGLAALGFVVRRKARAA